MFKRYFGFLAVLVLSISCMSVSTFAVEKLEEYVKAQAGETTGDGNNDFNDAIFKQIADEVVKSSGLKPTTDSIEAKQRENAGYYAYGEGDNTYYIKPSMAANIASRYQSQKISEATDDTAIAKQEVSDMLDNINVKPDMDTASQALSGFGGVISVAVGVIIAIITLLTVLITTCDICYITLPVFRETQDTAGKNGSGFNAIVNRLISNEARYCVKECSVDSGKNPLGMYLGKRVFAYILLALALFILLTGNIAVIINIVLTGVAGIADALKTLGGGI